MQRVLGEPSYRAEAGRVRDAMATLPGPKYAVTLLDAWRRSNDRYIRRDSAGRSTATA